MEELLKVIVLGIIEGITEFLPISSTGHLIVAAEVLRFQGALDGTFEIFIQIGAVVAVMLHYRADLLQQARSIRSDAGVQRLWLGIVVASIPAAIIGFLARDFVKESLFNPVVVAITLILGGIVFIIVERSARGTADNDTHALTAITLRQALMIGTVQVLALIPGVSRSGAAILGGLFSGLDRATATAFSFYLAIPVLGGATVLDLLLSLDEIQPQDWVNLIIGAVISGVVAWLSIRWLLNYVARHDFVSFGIYRILVGAVILLLVVANAL